MWGGIRPNPITLTSPSGEAGRGNIQSTEQRSQGVLREGLGVRGSHMCRLRGYLQTAQGLSRVYPNSIADVSKKNYLLLTPVLHWTAENLIC